MKIVVAALLLLLCVSSVHSADTLLVSVQESGGDYASVEAALDAHEQNLVTNDSVLVIEISGTWSGADVTEVSVNGYWTDSTHPIIIRAVGDSRHDGKWSTTAYRHERPTRVLYGAFAVYENNVRLEWLQVHQKTSSNYDCCINNYPGSDGGDVQISNCILKATDGTGGYSKGVNMPINGGWDVWNCVIYDFNTSNSKGLETKASNHMYNNTIWGCDQGLVVSSGTGTVAKNNLIGNCGLNYNGNFHVNSDYNGSDDTTSTDGGNDRINQTFTFEDEGNNDFHLASNDAGALDYGTDLSSDPDRAFSDDIDGETRTGTWDMGADEYIVTAAGQVIMIQQ